MIKRLAQYTPSRYTCKNKLCTAGGGRGCWGAWGGEEGGKKGKGGMEESEALARKGKERICRKEREKKKMVS